MISVLLGRNWIRVTLLWRRCNRRRRLLRRSRVRRRLRVGIRSRPLMNLSRVRLRLRTCRLRLRLLRELMGRVWLGRVLRNRIVIS